MNQQTLEYVKRSLLHRRLRVIYTFVIFVIMSIIVVRLVKTPYQSELRMLMDSKTSETRGLASIGIESGMSSFETASQIARQEILLKSYRTYEYMVENSKYFDGSASKSSLVVANTILIKFMKMLYGREYVEAQTKWSQSDYSAFKSNIIFKVEQDTPSFRIGYVHPDPSISIAITQELADTLIAVNRNISKSNNRDIAVFLENKVADLQNQVEEQSEKIASFMKSERFPNSSAIMESRYKGYLDAQQGLVVQTSNVKQVKALLAHSKEYVKKMRSLLADSISDNTETERISRLIAEIRSYETSFERIQPKGENSKSIDAARLKSLREKLEQKIQSKKSVLSREAINTLILDGEKRVGELESELLISMQNLALSREQSSRFAKDIERLPSLQADLQRMLNKEESLTNTLKVLEERYFEVLIKQDSDLTNLVIIDLPSLASSVTSSKSKILMLLIIGSLFAAAALFILLDIWKGTIYDPSQIARNNITYLGALPHFTPDEIAGGLWTHENIAMIVHELRRSLELNKSNGLAKVAHFISSDAGAGKSMTSLSVAMGLARKGLRVLLIDADYRAAKREGLQKYVPSILGKDFEKRVDELKGPEKKEGQVGYANNITLATVFNQDTSTQEMPAFFSKKLFQSILHLSGQFDYILIDMPPLFFTDTLEVLSQVDAAILCAKEGQEKISSFSSAILTIEKHKKDNTKIFSVITDSHFSDGQKRSRYQYYFKRRGAA